MAKRVQRIGHQDAEAQQFIGKEREITVNTTNGTMHVHDGATAGGVESARRDLSTTPDATTNQPGRMSTAQVASLAQVIADTATNAAAIAQNASDISDNVDAINANTASINSLSNNKADKVSGTGHDEKMAKLTDDGNLDAAGFTASQVVNFATDAAFMLFRQAAAPSGWAIDATQNDKVLRVNASNGSGSGGSWNITGFTSGAHAITIGEMPAHRHYLFDDRATSTAEASTAKSIAREYDQPSSDRRYRLTTGGTDNEPTRGESSREGSSEAHSHSLTYTAGWRPAYIDVLVCKKL